MLARAQCAAAPPAAALARPPVGGWRPSRWRVQPRGSLSARADAAAGSGSGGRRGGSRPGGSSPDPSSIEDRSGLSEAQLQAAAEQLMRSSRDDIKQRQHSNITDESMRQRMVLVLRLGFSQAAIEAAIERETRAGKPGGPYIVEQHIGEAAALLQRWGFSQQQLDGALAKGNAFSRAAADIEAVLAWLQREFGMKPGEVVQACSKSPAMLNLKQATLESNWRAFEAAFRPTPTAKVALAAALRRGRAHFIIIPLETVREKVVQLQQLFDIPDHEVPSYIGHMAGLFSRSISGTVQPRMALLQALTGIPTDKLGPRVLGFPTLLSVSEELLQRKRDALAATMGEEAARTILCMKPDVLVALEDRAALNIAALQRLFGCSRDSAASVLCANTRLLKLNMQSGATTAKLRARVQFWQQAYGLNTAGEAAAQCVEMLHRSLRTVGPRVAFYQQQWPGKTLPGCSTLIYGDTEFCRRCKLDPLEFAAFKQRWLLSKEGQALCQHNGKQSDRQPKAAA